jgi:hypothetical protein
MEPVQAEAAMVEPAAKTEPKKAAPRKRTSKAAAETEAK